MDAYVRIHTCPSEFGWAKLNRNRSLQAPSQQHALRGETLVQTVGKQMDDNVLSVLILEDHDHTATRLRRDVMRHPDLTVCAVASSLHTGLVLFNQHKPRIVLCDLGLPDGTGIDLIKAVARCDWDCDSIVISVFGDEERVLNSIRAGARGYILKNSNAHDLASDILSVIHGGSPISPKIARYLLTLAETSEPAREPAKEKIILTGREAEILMAVAKGHKRHEIAANLLISAGTVGNHINNIYKKLAVNSSIEAISEANKMGLL